MMYYVLVAICAIVPLLAIVVEWLTGSGISERHHSHHDTYLMPRSMTGVLVISMAFMGVLGILLGWLCRVGVFVADDTAMISFFASFVVVMCVMWLAMRRYRVSTYDDHMDVVPYFGRVRTIRYADIDQLLWSRPNFMMRGRSISVIVDGDVKAVLNSTFDLDQILIRINRNDVLENAPH